MHSNSLSLSLSLSFTSGKKWHYAKITLGRREMNSDSSFIQAQDCLGLKTSSLHHLWFQLEARVKRPLLHWQKEAMAERKRASDVIAHASPTAWELCQSNRAFSWARMLLCLFVRARTHTCRGEEKFIWPNFLSFSFLLNYYLSQEMPRAEVPKKKSPNLPHPRD